MIVADTNLVVYLLIDGPYTEAAKSALRQDAEWVAPSSWRAELLNVLSTYCRKGEMTVDKGTEAYAKGTALVSDIPFDVDPTRVLRLSKDLGLAGYDCIFLAAAEMNMLPLVTFDQQLLDKAPRTAIRPEGIEQWFMNRNSP